MSLIQAVFLGIIQGLSEFLPISSSGHLILAGSLFGTHQSLAFDVALHVGTLSAVLAVFGGDYLKLARDLIQGKASRLTWFIALGTIPAVGLGLVLSGAAETVFRSNLLVAFNLVGVAILMLVVERAGRHQGKLDTLNSPKALWIGLAQAAAIVPGISRSGATITSGMFLGLTREAAMRFSFLLSGPVIAGAALKVLIEPSASSQIAANTSLFAAGALAAAVSGYLTIRFMLNYLVSHKLDVFAYYRITLGVLVIVLGAM